jgi:hypothetical protein
MHMSPTEEARRKRREAERQLLFGIVYIIVALLALVVVVGLIRGDIDVTGTATVLGGLVGTIVGGLLLKGGGEK